MGTNFLAFAIYEKGQWF